MGIPALTPSERHEAALRLFCVIEKAKEIKGGDAEGPGKRDKRAVAAARLLRQEKALAAELAAQWRKAYADALKVIFESIPEEITEDAMTLIEDGILSALGPAFGNSASVRGALKKYIKTAYEESKREWVLETPKSRNSPLLSLPDRRAIEVLTRHNCFWLGEHYGEHVGPKISEMARAALESGIGRKALAEDLKRGLGGIAPEDYGYWDVAASSALVRARSFGAVSGMEEAGIAEYEVLAMGDERMCKICGEMDGRTFSVGETRKVIDSALGIQDPEAFKKALPWQSKPAVGISGAALARSGQSVPPFHGRCRCTLIAVSESEPITKKSFPRVEPENVKTFDPDTRIAVISQSNLPKSGLANWKYDKISNDGRILQRRFYDCEGNAFEDVDMTNHGQPRAHPHVPHVHEWEQGVRNEKFRKPKTWEREMAEELGIKVTKKESYDAMSAGRSNEEGYYDGNGHFASADDLLRALSGRFGCNEIEFGYEGHSYGMANYDPPQAWEANKDDTLREFKDARDMIDNYTVHTGETLREIATELVVESSSF
jgi:hypothetical protein